MDLQHVYTQHNGIKQHFVTKGQGPLLVLLHGFPEFWYSWRHQIDVLAKYFQVVAPDLRGYGESDKPQEVEAYKASTIVSDIVALIKSLGHQKAHIVGHDWGGGIAWRLAMSHPEIVDHLVVINCPHPAVMQHALKSNHEQMLKSWYIFFFQLPLLPELLLNWKGKDLLKKLFKRAFVNKKALTSEDFDRYYQNITQPGAYTGALNYYRAALRYPTSNKAKIEAPTLIIWGIEDKALGKELAIPQQDLFTHELRVDFIPEAGHFVHEEKPDEVNHLILAFLRHKQKI